VRNHPVQRDLYQDVLSAVAEGAGPLTPQGRIGLANPAEDRLFGYGPGELAGRAGVFQAACGKGRPG
jgi:PAS domain-containing protein